MQKNDLLEYNENVYRVVSINEDKVLVIDCINLTMPRWIDLSDWQDYSPCSEEKLLSITDRRFPKIEELNQEQMKVMHNRFTLIAPILSYITDEPMKNRLIADTAERHKVSKQTVRRYLCLYLAFPNITILAPTNKEERKELTTHEKNFRWALNKYYYTRYKNSLRTTYLYMLRDKYTNENGELIQPHPTFRQFQYYYSKHKSLQTYYISRDGLSNYQRNHRPLLGEGVRDFAPNVGVGMLDSTVCDIYLINESGEVVGRPILTACLDAYSGLCMGYFLGWEGGVYSLRALMLNVISDKVNHCKKSGINIDKEEWDCSELPSTLITDRGSEYQSATFEQITELGLSVINLAPYRADLKSVVEKFFDCIQSLYKPLLKGKGVIEEDFQERGGHDYRKDSCLTIEEFEKILIHCILYYNNSRIIDLPNEKELIENGVKPHASSLWKWGKNCAGANVINVDKQTLTLCLLPRTRGKFTRSGLVANKLRYTANGFTERYLQGGDCTIAYNADNASTVWLIENGSYTPFRLILSEFEDMSLSEIEALTSRKKALTESEQEYNLQARLALIESIETIAHGSQKGARSISNIRSTRTRETKKKHRDYVEETNG